MTHRTPGQMASMLLDRRVRDAQRVRFDQLDWRVAETRGDGQKEPERPHPSNAVLVYTCSVHRREGSGRPSESR